MKKFLLSLSAFLTMATTSSAMAYYVYCPWPYRPVLVSGYQYVWNGWGWVLMQVNYWACA